MKRGDLVVVLREQRAGVLTMGRGGKPVFTYDARYRADPEAALSLSMPLARGEHTGSAVESFFWNLLPDNDAILSGWARRFGVSSGSLFGLLAHVGEDCPGAVQIVSTDRTTPGATRGAITWLTDADIAERLRTLRVDPSASRADADSGQFSLAGAQPKTALLLQGERWGVPSGRLATTHILKPPIERLDGHAENEHACLELARDLGMSVARSEVRRFGDEVAIVVERFDRLWADDGALARIHQEDFCQALGVHPRNKYETDGGPTAAAMVAVLRDHSTSPAEDVGTIVDALIFSWLVSATDAHAKNYALLHGRAGRVRLAPLYDIASVLPYPQFDPRRAAVAMKIGGKARIQQIGLAEWRKLARQIGVDEAALIARARTMAAEIADRYAAIRSRLRAQGLTHPVLDRLGSEIAARAARARAALS